MAKLLFAWCRHCMTHQYFVVDDDEGLTATCDCGQTTTNVPSGVYLYRKRGQDYIPVKADDEE